MNFEQTPGLANPVPLDIVNEIVDRLASLPSSALRYAPGVVNSLLSLCLVSKAVNRRATFHLYSHIFVRDVNRMGILVQNNVPHPGIVHLRSLSLDFHTSFFALAEHYPIAFLVSVGATIRRLSININTPGMEHVRESLIQLALRLPSLDDLAIVHPFSWNLRAEPNHVMGFDSGVQSPTRRVMMRFNGLLSMQLPSFLRLFPSLEVVVIALPGPSTIMSPYVIEQVGLLVPWIREIMFVYPSQNSFPQRMIDLSAAAKHEFAVSHAGSLSIREFESDVHHLHFSAWLAEQVQDGSLWDLPGEEWLGATIKTGVPSTALLTMFLDDRRIGNEALSG